MFLKTFLRRALVGACATVLTLLVAAPLAAQSSGLKIAVVDNERLISDSTMGKAALEKLKKLQEEKLAENRTKQSELDELNKKLSEGRLSLSEDKLQEIGQQIQAKQTELKRFQEDAQRQLDEQRKTSLGGIEKMALQVIDAYGKEQGYDLIFGKYTSGLVYASDATDVTDEILSRLDAAASADK